MTRITFEIFTLIILLYFLYSDEKAILNYRFE